MKQQQR